MRSFRHIYPDIFEELHHRGNVVDSLTPQVQMACFYHGMYYFHYAGILLQYRPHVLGSIVVFSMDFHEACHWSNTWVTYAYHKSRMNTKNRNHADDQEQSNHSNSAPPWDYYN
ncbi:hypothetical protein D3C80_1477210 [compost metagenome]